MDPGDGKMEKLYHRLVKSQIRLRAKAESMYQQLKQIPKQERKLPSYQTKKDEFRRVVELHAKLRHEVRQNPYFVIWGSWVDGDGAAPAPEERSESGVDGNSGKKKLVQEKKAPRETSRRVVKEAAHREKKRRRDDGDRRGSSKRARTETRCKQTTPPPSEQTTAFKETSPPSNEMVAPKQTLSTSNQTLLISKQTPSPSQQTMPPKMTTASQQMTASNQTLSTSMQTPSPSEQMTASKQTTPSDRKRLASVAKPRVDTPVPVVPAFCVPDSSRKMRYPYAKDTQMRISQRKNIDVRDRGSRCHPANQDTESDDKACSSGDEMAVGSDAEKVARTSGDNTDTDAHDFTSEEEADVSRDVESDTDNSNVSDDVLSNTSVCKSNDNDDSSEIDVAEVVVLQSDASAGGVGNSVVNEEEADDDCPPLRIEDSRGSDDQLVVPVAEGEKVYTCAAPAASLAETPVEVGVVCFKKSDVALPSEPSSSRPSNHEPECNTNVAQWGKIVKRRTKVAN